MKTKRQYLLVDTKKNRRHSAPDNLGLWFVPQGRFNSQEQRWPGRASVSDFSTLFEKESESGSSQELDTSNLSRDLSPVLTARTTPRDSYQSLPLIDYGNGGRHEDEHSLSWRVTWKNLLLSHAIAGCLAVMNICNDSLKEHPYHLITNGQNLPHYVLLSMFWTTKLVMRNDGRDFMEVIKFSGLRYLCLSILHVEVNYLLQTSFYHNTFLGNQMIDCVAASLSAVIAYVCLEVQFHLVHVSGLVCGIAGAIGLSIANAIYKTHIYKDVLLGDVLRITSGICLALNSIAQEIITKSIDYVEYMGMVGLMGSLICGFQTITFEANKSVPRTVSYWMNMFSYSLSQFLLNSLTPIVLREMGASGLHLSLTASAFYSYFFAVYGDCNKVQILYLVSFVVTITGSLLFAVKRTITGTQTFFPVKVIISKSN